MRAQTRGARRGSSVKAWLVDEPAPQHFTGRLSLTNIYGEWRASARDGFFTVRWGRFFAYLHQFDEQSQRHLIAACSNAHDRRDRPHGLWIVEAAA